ncbi:hypothetical protein VXQ18_14745 [Brucella abortus]|nr:hypothetical protein [Brucella abortus]
MSAFIMDVVRGNQTLFMRRDEVEAAWRWIDPILQAWEFNSQPVQGYTAGTWGPSSSIALIGAMAAHLARKPLKSISSKKCEAVFAPDNA